MDTDFMREAQQGLEAGGWREKREVGAGMYRGVLGVSSSVGGVACCLFVVVVVVGEKKTFCAGTCALLCSFSTGGGG